MNRRFFLKTLGAAALGAAVTLKVAPSLLPAPVRRFVSKNALARLYELVESYETYYGYAPEVIVVGSELRDAVMREMNDERIVCNVMHLDGGYRAFTFWGIPLITLGSKKVGPWEMQAWTKRDFLARYPPLRRV